nr:MAG TPA: hypothetical protein [Caudoviricetes sp.]
MRRHRFESCRSNCDFNSQREVLKKVAHRVAFLVLI